MAFGGGALARRGPGAKTSRAFGTGGIAHRPYHLSRASVRHLDPPPPQQCASWKQTPWHGRSPLPPSVLLPDSEGASGCTRSTARATAPSPGRPTPGVVKQDKSSGGSVDTTKTRPGPQRVRMSGGERPIGAAKGKQSDTEALCQPPPPSSAARGRA